MKAVINGVLSIKDIVLVVHVTLVKPSAMQKLDGINNVNPTKSSKQPKHLRKNIELCFKWTVISNAPKKTKIGKNFKASYILFCGFLILINKRTLQG